ncbi:hypothetical protein RS130_02015 [Paraglaciecola aquimarina]|uniref:Lipoprotein n=1 Tax=Paraglaciecola aquimarina TaxID=1235557 RepID=A0ABU3SS74_9ALTE|nr:hypothetical protein [Paraglaciecola aquimarina]MDU0352861.1 hypothetical protein [Paraglaciecola aquimarina]
MTFKKTLLALSIALLASCGDSDDNPSTNNPTTQTGFFIDSAVQGLAYRSDSTSGITGADGSFEFVEGETITFSVGSLELGSAVGDTYITPISLVSGATASNEAVINIVRLLLMLDTDNDSSNGITVSTEVQGVAASWTQVNFTDVAINSLLQALMAEVEMADSRTATLSSAATAQAHLELSYACIASGVFSGTFSGDDSGTFGLLLEAQRIDLGDFGDNLPRTGVTSAVVYSSVEEELYVTGFGAGLSFDSSLAVIAGSVNSGAEFSGNLTDNNMLAGNWRNDIYAESGTFSGERIAGDPSAIHRLSGIVLTNSVLPDADNIGYIAVDVFANNSSSGYIVLIDGTQIAISGTYNPETSAISLSGEDKQVDINFDPSGDAIVVGGIPSFTGTWTGQGTSGNVGGSSCQLNNLDPG